MPSGCHSLRRPNGLPMATVLQSSSRNRFSFLLRDHQKIRVDITNGGQQSHDLICDDATRERLVATRADAGRHILDQLDSMSEQKGHVSPALPEPFTAKRTTAIWRINCIFRAVSIS